MPAAAILKSNNSSEGYPTSLPGESTGKRYDMPASVSGSGEEMKVPSRMFRFFFPKTITCFFLISESRLVLEY